MIDLFRSLLDAVAQYPGLAALLAFVIAMAEAMLVIGLFVPSTAVLVGLGSLIGLGRLDFLPIFLAATAGAVAGDAFSYWIGRAYGHRLLTLPALARYRGMIESGERYFHRHGGKSVVIGRFVPVVKSVVPAVAGMLGMGPARFAALNISSAVVWAAAHLVPGYLAGAALLIAGLISKRLVIALVALALSVLLVMWLASLAVRLGARALPRAQSALVAWAATQPAPHGPTILRLVSPDHADFRLLAILLALFATAIIGGAALVDGVVAGDPVVRFDTAFSGFLQELRTAWGDRLMIGATMLGDTAVTVAVTVAAAAALVTVRRRRLALGLALALLAAVAFVFGLKGLIQAPRPSELYAGVDAFSFPSGHATTAATLYGLLGLIALRGFPTATGRRIAAALAVLVALVCFSRVYLAAHWPSDVAEGLLFGAAATSGLALVFRGYDVPGRAARWTLGAAAAALLLAGGWHIERSFAAMEMLYARPAPPEISLSGPWREGGWRDLPAHRIDLVGEEEEPLLLQWRGSAGDLANALGGLGWSEPPAWSLSTMNALVLPSSGAVDLPVIPALHNGRRPAVTAILTVGPKGAGRYVLRAWEQETSTNGGPHAPVLLASVVREIINRPLGLIALPLPDEDAVCDGERLLARLPAALAVGPTLAALAGACSGRVVLAGATTTP